MAICDGARALALPPAQDFKRVSDGDQGPNTGGMGAYSPVPAVDESLVEEIMERAVNPTLNCLRDRGIDYRGVLYAGVILTPEGPKILEFNVRFGDPETQAVLPRWEGDVAEVLAAAAAGRLDTVAPPTFSADASVTVVAAVPGYPTSPRIGDLVEGFLDAAGDEGVHLYSAGMARSADGEGLVTAGGRVLALQALGVTVDEARRRVYEAIRKVSWPGMHYRHDIAAGVAAPAR
jgi:phosphoribosylamine--glycine ligase